MGEPSQTPTDGTSDDTAVGRRWVELIPFAVVVLVGVPVLVLRPAIVQGTLGSPRALAVTAGVTVVILVWSAALRRLAVPAALRAALVLAPILVAGLLWIRPYFVDTRVDEEFPLAAAVPTEPAAATSQPAVDPSTPGPSPPTSEQADASRPTEAPSSAAPVPSPTPSTPSGPVVVSRGRFVGLDGHRARGMAALYRLEDDSVVVRLEKVNLQSVPDAYVHLVPRADATAPGRRSVELGPLKGNVGSSNYPVPNRFTVDLDREWTVLVWCRPFASPVGAASQQPVP